MSNCDDSSKSCSTHGNQSGESTQKSCAPQETCCPVEKSIEMWSASFCAAMQETQKEILKEKIRKAWGPVMDKVGDAVVQAMGTQWHSMLAQAKAHVDLRDNVRKVFESVLK